jgi:hypothetical protein
MFNIAIPLIPIGFIADTFYIDMFCSDRFHTVTFHTDMFCLCTITVFYSISFDTIAIPTSGNTREKEWLYLSTRPCLPGVT